MIEINFEFPDMLAKVQAKRAAISLRLAAAMQTNRGLLFDSEGRHNGHEGWAPLRFRTGMILSNRGTLRKSMAPQPAKGRAGPDGIVELGPDLVTIGTTLKYAAMMNFGTTNLPGGVLKAKNGKALKIPLPQGKNATEGAQELSRRSALANTGKRISLLMERRNKARKPARIAALNAQITALQAQLGRKSAPGAADKFIFRKSVKIPARRFDQITAEDQREFEDELTQAVIDVLNGRL